MKLSQNKSKMVKYGQKKANVSNTTSYSTYQPILKIEPC